ncbi:MAG TPA: MarR family winged helix-turn-helix transcriptional regulator [Micromonosporaceae bacterium]
MTGRDLTQRQHRAWAAYHRMQGLLGSQLNRRLIQETGLSEADYEILAALQGAEDHRLRALALRCAVQWEKSRLSHHLARMQRRGLVLREDCVEDSRGAVYRLTEAGRTAVAAAQSSRTEAVRTYLVGLLTAEQLDALADISDAILRRLAEESDHRHALEELARGTS